MTFILAVASAESCSHCLLGIDLNHHCPLGTVLERLLLVLLVACSQMSLFLLHLSFPSFLCSVPPRLSHGRARLHHQVRGRRRQAPQGGPPVGAFRHGEDPAGEGDGGGGQSPVLLVLRQ